MLRSLTQAELAAIEQEVASEERKRTASPFAKYTHDPVAFAREVLGIEPWSRQRELLHAVRDHDRVTVRSGHKVSKSTSAGILAWWWTSDPIARPSARCILTSSGNRQVKSILWREIKRLYRGAKQKLGPEPADAPDTGVQWSDGREIIGFTTKEPEKMAGFSGAHLLFILDEASGIPEAIFEAIEGNRAGGAKILLLSNPTQTSGEFYESHTKKRAFYHCLRISSEESPNVTGEANVPGLATKAWIDEKVREWGRDSPLFSVRIGGDFPTQSTNAVVGLGLVLSAVARWEETEAEGELEFGLDVARSGEDESVLYARRGNKALAPYAWRGLDGIELANEVLKVVRELRLSPREIPRVKVDANGVGASPYDALSRSSEVETIAVMTAEASSDAETYSNLRAQIAFGLAAWIKEGGAISDHAQTQADLVAPKYAFDVRNRLKIESKEELKKRLGRSPDYGDALALAVYSPPRLPDAVPMPDSEEEDRWGSDARSW